MKKLLFLSILMQIVFVLKAQDNEAKIYLIKSGYIEYELTGSTTGTKTIWWDNYGEWSYEEEKSVTKMKVFGMTSEEKKHTITVSKDGLFWTANMLERTGIKGREITEDIQEDISDMDEEELEKTGRELFKAMGGKELPPETFLGRKCNVLEIMGAKSYIYKNIPLKSTIDLMGIKANITAIKMEENISIPESKFKPVSGIEYLEISIDNDWF